MTDAFGLIGLVAAPPLAVALQLWIDALLTPPAPAGETVPTVELADLHAKLAEARAALDAGGAPPAPHVASLFGRLEDLIGEVEAAQR
jgi:hypothetical protein